MSASVKHKPRGKFITLEGLEGVGKTTNREYIESLLNERDIVHIVTREPGGTPVGEQLRQLVLHDAGTITPAAELLIMAASRVEHVAQVIEPALVSGVWVLCDRFLDASVAYQGAGRGLGTSLVRDLHRDVGVVLQPDLTLLLDMPVKEGLARMSARGEPDRIERETLEFFERARAAYLDTAAAEPTRVQIIDAGRSLVDVQAEVATVVRSLIDKHDKLDEREKRDEGRH